MCTPLVYISSLMPVIWNFLRLSDYIGYISLFPQNSWHFCCVGVFCRLHWLSVWSGFALRADPLRVGWPPSWPSYSCHDLFVSSMLVVGWPRRGSAIQVNWIEVIQSNSWWGHRSLFPILGSTSLFEQLHRSVYWCACYWAVRFRQPCVLPQGFVSFQNLILRE